MAYKNKLIISANVLYLILLLITGIFILACKGDCVNDCTGQKGVPSMEPTPCPPTPPHINDSVTQELCLVDASFPAFLPAQAEFDKNGKEKLHRAICKTLRVLNENKSSIAIVVGMYDERELSQRARLQFRSNAELAKARAGKIKELLLSEDCQIAIPTTAKSVYLFIGSPSIHSENKGLFTSNTEAANKFYENDRAPLIFRTSESCER